jgi:hypothetical protein
MDTVISLDHQLGKDESELVDEVCTGCGAIRERWSDPVSKEGDRYCCTDCAEEKACNCSLTSPEQ